MKKIGDDLEICDLTTESSCATDDKGNVRAVIKPLLHTQSSVKVLYMASLELDGMEMHESVRLSVDPGKNIMTLPEIVVINPLRSNGQAGNYTLTLKIYASGGVVHDFSSIVSF